MCDLNGAEAPKKQPPKIARLGARLDALDTANRMAFEAIYSADPLDCDAIRAAEIAWDSTCAPLSAARHDYFACARRAAARTIPKLPKDVSAARAVVQAARDADRAASSHYANLLELDFEMTGYRLLADAAADSERRRFVFESLRDSFDGLVDRVNARTERESEHAATAQARAFEWQEIAAQRQMLARRRESL